MGDNNDNEEFYDALDDADTVHVDSRKIITKTDTSTEVLMKPLPCATEKCDVGLDAPIVSSFSSSTNESHNVEESIVIRRRKLDELRIQLQQDLNGHNELFNSSESDLSSLASWSKLLLSNTGPSREAPLAATYMVTVFPLDSVSTRGGEVASETAAKCIVTVKASEAENLIVAKDGSSKVSGPSTGSSKASTLERFETAESHSSSLEKDLRLSRSSLCAKTGSLTRDFTGDQLLMDEAHLAYIERKNSEAIQVIEALTNEIVRSTELSKSKDEEAEAVAPGVALREPDIVASNRIKLIDSLQQGSNPVRPPRKKKVQQLTSDRHSKTATAEAPDAVSSPRNSLGLDETVLDTVMVKNLDTGEQIPLSLAEEKIPRGINPLCLHIMRLTNDFSSNQKCRESDSESMASDDVGSVQKLGFKDSYLHQAKEKTYVLIATNRRLCF
ncbi:unnamed protein product [Soboliphyme baturini]|uniref:PH domain-containing protein n=1 Tax=Soboliphyme baturini TaxID=241478 RepID=A0A183IJB7_9BILA|nr:unnamed protein product [Soboliphyme baturini]